MSAPRSLGQTHGMRILSADAPAADATTGSPVDDDLLDRLYAHPGPLLRLNFVSTLDGSATGPDGLSGSINSTADHRAFTAMRHAADVVLVGAGTARAEGYGAAGVPLVVVSRRGVLPESLRGADQVVLVTTRASGVDEGEDRWLCGDETVDLAQVVERARSTFGPHVLCEGGPSLAADLVAAGLVDELGLTWTPLLVGGHRVDHPRILDGDGLSLRLTSRHLLEEDGTLVGLWGLAR